MAQSSTASRTVLHADIKPSNAPELATRFLDVPNMAWEETKFPGIQIKVLYSDDEGRTTALFKLAPGAVVPLHEHTALEQTYVLEGTLEDHEGICGAGQFCWRPAGNQHEATAPNGAVILGFFLKPNRFAYGESVSIVPMSVMRRKIAEHMVLSAHTSPHVYSVYEVNFGRVASLREKRKAEYQAGGAKLTYTGFIAKVIVDALREFPAVNASIDGDNIVYKKDINLGIAVALDHGLLVPVIRNADGKNLLGLSRAINDVAERARSKKLNPEEVQQGTFTITNPGIFGALYGLPLINQPQVAILGVGTIEKRAVVIDDAIAIRPMCHLTLGYDHRLIDGADAGRFLTFVKDRLEKFDEAWM